MTLVNKGNKNEGYVFTLQRPDGAVLDVFESYEDLCEVTGKMNEPELFGYVVSRRKLIQSMIGSNVYVIVNENNQIIQEKFYATEELAKKALEAIKNSSDYNSGVYSECRVAWITW